MSLRPIDWIVMLIYVGFVVAIGVILKRYMKTSTDFFLSGRALPAWVCGLAFLSANLGAVEVIGMGASGAKYGISTSHFYWIGAIPAMVFVGVFMMPFYYGSRARSVPEYLRLRFDEKTRTLNAVSFAVMTIFSSGISMYAMARLIQVLHLFDAPLAWLGISPARGFDISIIVSALIVLIYVFFGGLSGAIYNEVLQFFMIVAGFLPLVWLGLRSVGGWNGLKARLPADMTHAWMGMTNSHANPMGVEWFGLAMGLGFVLSFGYWCTDFLVIQRAMAAQSMSAARRTPLIAAVPKMLFPMLVILPGLIAVGLPTASLRGVTIPKGATSAEIQAAMARAVPTEADLHSRGLIPPKIDVSTGRAQRDSNGNVVLDYDLAIPNMLLHYFPAGLLGLGLTALLASFMSGMAGNVTAFNTVWTYDIYQAHIHPGARDAHYLKIGRITTVAGIVLSVLAAYMATRFNNIMDMLQLIFAFVNAPLFATFLLGMFWKRTTGHGAFYGLLSGTIAAALHHGLTLPVGEAVGVKGGWLGAQLHQYPSDMAQNFWTAIFAWTTCFIATILISLMTQPRPEKELNGLVYSLTPKPNEGHLAWYARPAALGIGVLVLVAILNFIFK